MRHVAFTIFILLTVLLNAQPSIGKHMFGVQFIWDHYGSATITREGNELKIEGSQYSKDKKDFCRISGTIEIISPVKFRFKGTISTMLKDCCGEVEKSGEFTFVRTGKRKFWRLQERGLFCDEYNTCSYYLDLFL